MCRWGGSRLSFGSGRRGGWRVRGGSGGGAGARPGRDEARLREGAADTAVVDLWLRDAAGAAFGRVRGLLLKRATRQALLGAAAGGDGLFYEVVWREVAARAATAAFLAGPAEVGALVAPRLETLAAGVGFEARQEAHLEA